MIVVDASVIVKAIVREPDAERALAFLDENGGRLQGPDILMSEVASAIVRSANARLCSLVEANERLTSWHEVWLLGLVEPHRLTIEQLGVAAALAIDLGHPLADCVYLGLAIALDCPLVTCDAKFAAKARVPYPRVALLADVTTGSRGPD